jgi:CO/xanthine dehydrogenase Mo-binding subunit
MSRRITEEKQVEARQLLEAPPATHLPVVASDSLPAVPALTPEVNKQTPAIGRRVSRPDIRTHITGTTRYIDDLSFPGMLHCKILRSAHAHARILSIEVGEAEKMPGVVATLTGAEVPVNSFGSTYQDQPVLAADRVRYRGDGVVAIAAETEQQALEALAAVKVEYQPLPAVFDPLEAMDPDAPKIHRNNNVYTSKVISRGDVERGFDESDQIFERRYTTQMIEHVPLEPFASIALWEPDGQLHVYSTNGRITLGRADLARTLSLPMNRIRLTATIIGGNFGGKNEIRTEPILALLAKKTGRPVKAVFSREEEFIASTTRHPLVMDYKTGVTNDGRLRARSVHLVLDGGAYASWSETTVGKAAILAAGPYRIPNVRVEGHAVYTNKTVTGAMRGFGAPQVAFAYESQMDEIAHSLGMDPLEIRLLNGFEEGSASHTGQILQAVALKETLLMAAKRSGWHEVGR